MAMYQIEFFCPCCNKEFVATWSYGAKVLCAHCEAEFETEYEEGTAGIQGPWLVEPWSDA